MNCQNFTEDEKLTMFHKNLDVVSNCVLLLEEASKKGFQTRHTQFGGNSK